MDRVSGLTLYEQGIVDEHARQDAYLIISEDIPLSDYAIEVRVPHAYLNKDASRMQKVITTVCLISFLVMAVIGFLVARISGKKLNGSYIWSGRFRKGIFIKELGLPGTMNLSTLLIVLIRWRLASRT